MAGCTVARSRTSADAAGVGHGLAGAARHIERVAELVSTGPRRWAFPPTSATAGSAPCGCTTRCVTRRCGAGKVGLDAPGPAELRHGPASAARAKAEGEIDRGVLDAVRYHSRGPGGVGHGRHESSTAATISSLAAPAIGNAARSWRHVSVRPGWRDPGGCPRTCLSPGRVGMDAARADGPVLEQSGRAALRVALGAAVAVAVAAGVWRFWPAPRERVQGHAYAVPTPAGRITVEVLNGTRRRGLARVATRVLRERGLDVVFFGNADTAADSTRVVVQHSRRRRTSSPAPGVRACRHPRQTLAPCPIQHFHGDSPRGGVWHGVGVALDALARGRPEPPHRPPPAAATAATLTSRRS